MGATVADMTGFDKPSQEEIQEQVNAALEAHDAAMAMLLENVFKKRFPDVPYTPDTIVERGDVLDVSGKTVYFFNKEPLVMFNEPEIVGNLFGQRYCILNPENEVHKKIIPKLKDALEKAICESQQPASDVTGD